MVRPSLVRSVISGVPSIGSEKSRTISSGPVVSRAPLAGDVRTKKLCAATRDAGPKPTTSVTTSAMKNKLATRARWIRREVGVAERIGAEMIVTTR